MTADGPVYTAYLDESLCLAKNGNWYHRGQEFSNQRLAELFHRSISWNEQEGKFFLLIGRERATFKIEDTAYFVRALNDLVDGWTLTLNNGLEEKFAPNRLSLSPDGALCVTLLSGQRARFLSSAYQTFVSHLVSSQEFEMNGKRYKIPST